MYQHRKKTREYLQINETQLRNFKYIADDLITQLLPLAIEGNFKPREYPFRLSCDDYQGLRLMGRRSSTFQLMFSTPHSLMNSSKNAKLMTPFGRLGFFDGLKGFQGGRPEIKMIVSSISGNYKSYLKRCADWRRIGVDILVRKAKEGEIKKTYLIIDDKEVWVTNLLFEELDINAPVNIKKITDGKEKERVLEKFEKLWAISQIAEELEGLSWRTHFKEKAEYQRKKKKQN
jgi:hypothetical protein